MCIRDRYNRGIRNSSSPHPGGSGCRTHHRQWKLYYSPIIVYRLCLLRLCGFTGRILHLQPHKRRNPQRRSESGIRRNQAGTGHAQTATLLQSAHSRRMDKNKPSLPYRIMRYLFSIFSPTMERFADPRHWWRKQKEASEKNEPERLLETQPRD